MNYYSEHSKVWVSVDVIIFGFDENKLKVLIGRRQMDPGRGEWSLYGGFVGADESIDDAVIDGKTCNEYSAVLDAKRGVEVADDAYIFVYPYSKQSKAGKSGTFKVTK